MYAILIKTKGKVMSEVDLIFTFIFFLISFYGILFISVKIKRKLFFKEIVSCANWFVVSAALLVFNVFVLYHSYYV